MISPELIFQQAPNAEEADVKKRSAMNPDAPKASQAEILGSRLFELRPRLHRYCARMTGSVIDGEDVLQDTLVKAFSALERNVVVDDLEPWLFRIAHNAAQDYLRRRSRQRNMIADADITMIEDPSASADHRYIAAMSLRTFMHLPVAQRGAVILVDVLGLSLHETCMVMGATLASTKASLHRGRTQLSALATNPEDEVAPVLNPTEERRLRLYVDLFNSRNFDAIRALIAEDVQLELVSRTRMRGKAEVSTYFGNYARTRDWALSLGFVDGRAAVLMYDPESTCSAPRGFMLIDWQGEEIISIRDFRYAPYCVIEANITRMHTWDETRESGIVSSDWD
jgi:RNA polymerase sigma factor (sigma-70 family)